MESDRVEKMNRLSMLGVEIYPTFRVDNKKIPIENIHPHFLENLPDLPTVTNWTDNRNITTCGRVMQINHMGGSKFIFIKNDFITMQGYVRKDNKEAFEIASLLQLGDIVSITGPIFKTKIEKPAILIDTLQFLSKSLRWDGKIFNGESLLTDKEELYRNRYRDMLINQNVIETFKARSKIIKNIRQFLDDRGFIEVETRYLQHTNGGASAKPFKTIHNALNQDVNLRIAPELDLKRLIVGGMEKIFEIGKSFRNEGLSKKHNPEFTSIEIYQAYADRATMMMLIMELLELLANKKIHSVYHMTNRIKALKPDATDEDILKIFDNEVEKTLIEPTLVIGMPLSESPLAKQAIDGTADRFELYWKGMEIANGYSELNDPIEQRKRFEAQITNKTNMEIDEDYLMALEYGMPPTGGIGIGIDRLVMCLLDKTDIRDVIAFPFYRSKT